MAEPNSTEEHISSLLNEVEKTLNLTSPAKTSSAAVDLANLSTPDRALPMPSSSDSLLLLKGTAAARNLTIALLATDSLPSPRIEDAEEEPDIYDSEQPPRLLLDAFGIRCMRPTKEYPPYEPERNVEELLNSSNLITLQIHAADESFRSVTVSPQMTSSELLYYYCDQIECSCPEYFALCIQNSEQQREWIKWLDPSATLQSQAIQDGAQIYIKVKFFKSPAYELDEVALELFYVQLKLHILSGQHFVSDSTALLLAAVQLQISRGNYVNFAQVCEMIPDEAALREILPSENIKASTVESWQRRIARIYKRLFGLSSGDAKWVFLRIARRLPTFGASFFTVFQGQLRVTLAIVEDGVLFFKEDDRTHADYYCFLDIIDWYPTRTAADGLAMRMLKRPDHSTTKPNSNEATNEPIELRVTYNCGSKDELGAILDLLNGYQGLYFALHATSRQSATAWQRAISEESERVRAIRSEQIRHEFTASSRLYLHTTRHSAKIFPSDVDFFVHHLRRICAINNTIVPSELIDQFDTTILIEQRHLTSIALPKLKLPGDALDYLGHALEKSFDLPSFTAADMPQSRFAPANLDLSFCGIGGDPISRFLKIATTRPFFKIALTGNSLGKQEELDALSNSLKPATIHSLVELRFASNSLSDKRSTSLFKILGACENLAILDLTDNKLATCEGFSELFTSKRRFTFLGLRGNKISDAGLDFLCKKLKSRSICIRELDLRANAFGKGASALAPVLGVGALVARLHLSGNDLSKSLPAIAQAIVDGKSVEHLSLGADNASSKFAEFAALMVSVQRTAFTSLSLHTACEKPLWGSLAQFLLDYKRLTVLSLHGNATTPQGLAAIVASLKRGCNVRHLDLTECSLSKKEIGLLADLVSKCSLSTLNLSGNRLTDELCAVIGSSLMFAETLLELKCSGCFIGSSGLKNIISALSKISYLNMLDLSRNEIGSAVIDEVIAFLRTNLSLGLLDLRGNPLSDIAPETLMEIDAIPTLCNLLMDS